MPRDIKDSASLTNTRAIQAKKNKVAQVLPPQNQQPLPPGQPDYRELINIVSDIANDPIWRVQGKGSHGVKDRMIFNRTKVPASINAYKRKTEWIGMPEMIWESIASTAMKKIEEYTKQKIENRNDVIALRDSLNTPENRKINRADDLVRLHVEILLGNADSLRNLHIQITANSEEKLHNMAALREICRDSFWQKAGKGIFGRSTPDSIKQYARILEGKGTTAEKWAKIKNIANEKLVAFNKKGHERAPELIALHKAILSGDSNALANFVTTRLNNHLELRAPKQKR